MKKNKPKENKRPFDRKEAFILAFKQDYATILKLSLIMMIFAIPTIIVVFGAIIELALLGTITAENAIQMYSIQLRMYIWLIPAMAVLSIGAAGGFYVVRRLVWGEDVIFFKDFAKGIKNNAGQSVVSGVFFAVFLGGLSYAMNMMVLNTSLGSAYWTLYIIQIFLVVAAVMLLLFQYAIIAVYNDGMFKIIRNSFALLWMSLPRSVVITFLVFAPLALLFSGVYIIYIIVVVLMALVGFGYGILLFTLHAHRVFDKYINKSAFPHIYKKGLYHEGTGIDLENDDYEVQGYNIDVE